MNIIGTYHIYYNIHIYHIYDKYKLIIAILCEFMRICSNSVEYANFVQIVRICSNCTNFVQIVRKAVLIFAHKKNRTNNKALCGSFVRIFCSF